MHSSILSGSSVEYSYCAFNNYLLTPRPSQSQVTLRTLKVEKQICNKYS